MFQLAQHIKPVPSAIYRLLQSIIDARTQAHAIFQQMASEPWSGTETEQRHSPPFHRRPHSSLRGVGRKPTKRMLAETKNWDPELDVARTTDKGTRKWRRARIVN
ncbi:hypothetical protein S7711_05456 [Stachybotrys chartarum IBT 7711]|uniref:Uncharacterized protein n=1 Tax=Stachybotrys chartarum (strain CBS 109288 / IBT 7711) TaxID=1280523 RepID=A0A084BAX6_STACB|nr:hypothetical protein S7711_05456 [Stachybotrys chartarum IBT 7711]